MMFCHESAAKIVKMCDIDLQKVLKLVLVPVFGMW